MTGETFALFETIAEEIGDERFIVGERDQTVAHVAGRQDAELFLQASRRAAVVADRHDRSEICRTALEAAQQRRKASAAADRDDVVARFEATNEQRVEQTVLARSRGAHH